MVSIFGTPMFKKFVQILNRDIFLVDLTQVRFFSYNATLSEHEVAIHIPVERYPILRQFLPRPAPNASGYYLGQVPPSREGVLKVIIEH